MVEKTLVFVGEKENSKIDLIYSGKPLCIENAVKNPEQGKFYQWFYRNDSQTRLENKITIQKHVFKYDRGFKKIYSLSENLNYPMHESMNEFLRIQ